VPGTPRRSSSTKCNRLRVATKCRVEVYRVMLKLALLPHALHRVCRRLQPGDGFCSLGSVCVVILQVIRLGHILVEEQIRMLFVREPWAMGCLVMAQRDELIDRLNGLSGKERKMAG
jgi:hypothetical protein